MHVDSMKVMYNGLFYNYPKKMYKSTMWNYIPSAMIAKGTDIKTATDILGHSNPNTTLSIYTHAFNEVKAKAGDEIADMLHLNEKYSINL
jgi:integrase